MKKPTSLLGCIAALGGLLMSTSWSFAAELSKAELEALAKSKNCMACHSVDKKMVGPALKEVAEKYKADAKAQDNLADKIVKGTKGTWGSIPMPPNNVSADDAKKLAGWVLSLNK